MQPEIQSYNQFNKNELHSSFEKMTAWKIEIIKNRINYTNAENFYSIGLGFAIAISNGINLNKEEK